MCASDNFVTNLCSPSFRLFSMTTNRNLKKVFFYSYNSFPTEFLTICLIQKKMFSTIVLFILHFLNKPGQVPSRRHIAISKAQRWQKDFKVSNYSLLQYPKNLNVGPNWRARGGRFEIFHPFCCK